MTRRRKGRKVYTREIMTMMTPVMRESLRAAALEHKCSMSEIVRRSVELYLAVQERRKLKAAEP